MTAPRDPTLDVLLDLDGLVLVVDPSGRHWVRFAVKQVPVSAEKPHGLDYSLTLTVQMSSGWWDSTTRILLAGSGEATSRIIATV